jgi:hypothetical protein
MTFSLLDSTDDDDSAEFDKDSSEGASLSNDTHPANETMKKSHDRNASLAKLEGDEALLPPETKAPALSSKKVRKRRTQATSDAVIVLKEERVSFVRKLRAYLKLSKASTFHDFLRYVYPQ